MYGGDPTMMKFELPSLIVVPTGNLGEYRRVGWAKSEIRYKSGEEDSIDLGVEKTIYLV